MSGSVAGWELVAMVDVVNGWFAIGCCDLACWVVLSREAAEMWENAVR